jgi:hypothetical protein
MLNHRTRIAITQWHPETAFNVARSYFFGVLGVLLGLIFLIGFFGVLAAAQQ